MENFHQMLLERHSIRRYTDRPIDGEDVKTILEAALLAPTSKNARSWQFVVVENPETVAAMFMHLQAAALGIGSCWVQVRGRETADGEPSENLVRDTLGIPNHMVVECIMTFGYSAETRKPVDPAKLQWEKMHIGTWRHEL